MIYYQILFGMDYIMDVKSESEKTIKSCFPNEVISKIASFASTSTLSNLHAAFFNPPFMNYEARMNRKIHDFCVDYHTRKQRNVNDLVRFNKVDNCLIEDLCCVFDYLKTKLMQSKDILIEQYYRSGRQNYKKICELFSYFNSISEVLIRFLWLHILLGNFSFRDLSQYKYCTLVLYSDKHFLKSEKSRGRTKNLNCTFQNLFIRRPGLRI